MKYFVDCEYDWNPNDGTIVPISIGIVAQNGGEFYAVTTMFAPRSCSAFVQEHVLPKLSDDVASNIIHEDRDTIAHLIKDFIGDDIPEFWGDYAAFDYVVLSMLMGDFADWPSHWPMVICDLQQTAAGRAAAASVESATPHHALADARAVRDAYDLAFTNPTTCSPNVTSANPVS